MPKILLQFCSQGHFGFYRAIQEVWGIECSLKWPFIDEQLGPSIELCTSLTLFLHTLFDFFLSEKTNVSWQKHTNRAGVRLMTKTNTSIFEKSDVFHQNKKIPALQLTSKYAQNTCTFTYIPQS